MIDEILIDIKLNIGELYCINIILNNIKYKIFKLEINFVNKIYCI